MNPKTEVEWGELSQQEKAEVLADVLAMMRKSEGLNILVIKRLNKIREANPGETSWHAAAGLMSSVAGWIHRHHGHEAAENAAEGVFRAVTANRGRRK